jgi:hypothetical protein
MTSMHQNFKWLIGVFGLGLILVVSSCASKVYFTHDAREALELAKEDPMKLQFYNDKEFLLRRKTTSRQLETVEGVVSKTEGLRVQDLRIRRGTPCRLDSIDGNSYFIRFEHGEGLTLRFYKNQYEHYQIWADRWHSGRGNIVYGGKDYVVERIGNDCLLMVKNSQSFRKSNQRRTAEGLDVNAVIREAPADSLSLDSLSLNR